MRYLILKNWTEIDKIMKNYNLKQIEKGIATCNQCGNANAKMKKYAETGNIIKGLLNDYYILETVVVVYSCKKCGNWQIKSAMEKLDFWVKQLTIE